MSNASVYNFTTGLYIQDNTYIATFDHNFFNFNGKNVLFKTAGTNMGEDIRFTNNTFASFGNLVTRCVDTGTFQTSLIFENNSFDDCQLYIGNGTLHTSVIGGHFENPSANSNDKYSFIDIASTASGLSSTLVDGVTFVQAATTKAPDEFIRNLGANLTVKNITVWKSGSTVANFVSATTTLANTTIDNVTDADGALTNMINGKFTPDPSGSGHIEEKAGFIPWAYNSSSTQSTYFYSSSTLYQTVDKNGYTGLGTSSPSSQFALDGVAGAFFRIFSSTKVKVLEIVDDLVNMENARVRQHLYGSFTTASSTWGATSTV